MTMKLATCSKCAYLVLVPWARLLDSRPDSADIILKRMCRFQWVVDRETINKLDRVWLATIAQYLFQPINCREPTVAFLDMLGFVCVWLCTSKIMPRLLSELEKYAIGKYDVSFFYGCEGF